MAREYYVVTLIYLIVQTSVAGQQPRFDRRLSLVTWWVGFHPD